jgi:hypothetical protein
VGALLCRRIPCRAGRCPQWAQGSCGGSIRGCRQLEVPGRAVDFFRNGGAGRACLACGTMAGSAAVNLPGSVNRSLILGSRRLRRPQVAWNKIAGKVRSPGTRYARAALVSGCRSQVFSEVSHLGSGPWACFDKLPTTPPRGQTGPTGEQAAGPSCSPFTAVGAVSGPPPPQAARTSDTLTVPGQEHFLRQARCTGPSPG